MYLCDEGQIKAWGINPSRGGGRHIQFYQMFYEIEKILDHGREVVGSAPHRSATDLSFVPFLNSMLNSY